MSKKIFIPTNPDAQQCVKNVLKYFSEISGDRVITGQHTQTFAMEELHHIKSITGKEPALLGFELLGYSPNINYFDTDDECIKEVVENYGTLKRAWEWAEKKGLITFTWHWFSPVGGRSKSFFTENTDFDAAKAITEGTAENKALISDMDYMAGLLRPFCDRGIPILWRPFHEGDGNWFWWGVKGPEVVKALWRIMYKRFTEIHSLNNLIWVWNTAVPECYPGDDVTDIISRDMYPKPNDHTAHEKEYDELTRITTQDKIALIGEIGTLPDIDEIHKKGIGWSSFMTWSKGYAMSEDFTSFEYLKKLYSSEYALTKDKLPELY